MIKDTILFRSDNGDVSTQMMLDKLKSVGAHDCDVLYIHTDMSFGLPTKELKRQEILAALLNVLEALNVKTLVFPTFTFSFCNNEPFDIQNSKTFMGALNEYVRKTGRGIRTSDPLLSEYVLGDPLNLVDNLSIYSIGKGSFYDHLHECDKKVKFLFFGADMRDCFTYAHYMEAIIGIPYRYNRTFTGSVIDHGKESHDQTAVLYSTYANCRLNPVPVIFNEMNKKGQLMIESIGNSSFYCFAEKDAYETISELLKKDPLCLTDGTFDETRKDTSYIKTGRIVTVK